MKNRLITTILTLFMCATAVSCGRIHDNSYSVVSVDLENIGVNSTTEASTATEITASTTTFSVKNNITTTIPNVINENCDDRKIVEEYYKSSMGDYDESSEPYIQENIDHLIDSTDLLAEKLLGIITSEEDALKKGKDVLIEIKGQEYIDEHESDYFLHNGKNVKFIRDNPPFIAKYYDEYDIWQVIAVLRTGKTEDGNTVVTTGTSPYVLIRGSDGKVVGIYH